MENFTNELVLKRKEFGQRFVFSIFGIFLLYIMLFLYLKNAHPDLPQIPLSVLFLSFVATGYISYLFSKTTISFKNTYSIVTISFFCLIFYLCLLLCHVSNTIYYFYVPIIILVLLITDFKKTLFVAVLFILLSIFTRYLAVFFDISRPQTLSASNIEILHILEWVEVFVVAYLSLFLLYYYIELKKIETVTINHFKVPEKEESRNEKKSVMSKTANSLPNDDKLNKLYKKIIDLFENIKPYQESDFTIKKLAEILDTNTSYVSRALNMYGKKNFNTLVNEYRISMVKE